MLIRPIDPANMKGLAGRRIEDLSRFLDHSSGLFRADIPDFASAVLLSANANGDRIPDIGYVGAQSYVKKLLEGNSNVDFASKVRAQDSEFDRAAAAGFAIAAEGHPVCELVETEVSLPGFRNRIAISYYRLICPMNFAGKRLLINLSLPTPYCPISRQPERDKGYLVLN
ncbi:hypothetical protein [Roseibium suaedae]|uniref:Uncharacterized protein n=1 Tax=Roseibium suaedae TaxID=735517 RepID=A0A1M7FEQ4_9HYPH|nr:hypothetical protein [Roseibium suaedae]SHM02443.1 hypothetical protein SAMN05444272_1590 [Roseibium suaedae]